MFVTHKHATQSHDQFFGYPRNARQGSNFLFFNKVQWLIKNRMFDLTDQFNKFFEIDV